MRSEKDISIFFLYLIWYLYNFTRFTSEKKKTAKIEEKFIFVAFFHEKKICLINFSSQDFIQWARFSQFKPRNLISRLSLNFYFRVWNVISRKKMIF